MSSSQAIEPKTRHLLLCPKQITENPPNYPKKIAIICAVVGLLIAAIGALCFAGIFPVEILGGSIGMIICLIVGATILFPSAYFVWKLW